MRRLPVCSGPDAVKAFVRIGYAVDHQTGSHIILRHPAGRRLTVPNHRELAKERCVRLIREAGLTKQQFAELLSPSRCNALLRRERRRLHFLHAAYIEIFGVAFIQKLDRNPIDTTRVRQTINTVTGLWNDDMSAVRQMPGHLFAVLWRCDRVHVA